ncbi:hypothetical protein WJX73_009422 [Symbiochloris irregularis]|uniref:FAS1 domain-containing protein n=1 Tax=Symbiochloris irregularis TaxID=706552 RepID=A0AAW1Q2Y4_9CHLO
MKLLSAAAVLAVLLAGAAPVALAQSSNPQFATYADFQSATNYTIFNALLRTTGLLDQLQNSIYNLTIFAPTDDAFQALATANQVDLIPMLAGSDMTDIFKYHFISTTTPISAISFANGQQLPTWLTEDNQALNVSFQGSGPTLNLAVVGGNPYNVVGFQNYDIGVGQGYIQGINGVLIPPKDFSYT